MDEVEQGWQDRGPRQLCLRLQLPHLSTEISHILPSKKRETVSLRNMRKFSYEKQIATRQCLGWKPQASSQRVPPSNWLAPPPPSAAPLKRACRVRRWLFDVHTLSAAVSRTAAFPDSDSDSNSKLGEVVVVSAASSPPSSSSVGGCCDQPQ